jgi:predicted ATPase
VIHLQSVAYHPADRPEDRYPFNVPAIATLDRLVFDTPVTFFAGENGTGKSTLLEAVAAGIGTVTVGGEDIASDSNLEPARELSRRLKFSWARKSKHGFFLRSEDFYNYARRTAALVKDLGDIATGYEESYSGYGLQLARGSTLDQRRALVERYGEDLNARSHGESFLQFFGSRFVPDGLYLLDEPDTPLSPQHELALLHMLKDMVSQDGQFVIATHSPILMAFPEATILSFDRTPIEPVPYEEVAQVRLFKEFLHRPAAYLRHL